MEQTQQRRSLSKFLSSQQLKKIMTQLLLSVSIFSFLFSYYHSLYSSSLLNHPRNLHRFSTNPFKFSSHAILNKSYIFLICNGLLVFLSKTSGLVRCSQGFDANDLQQKRSVNGESCLQLQMYNNFFEAKEPFSQIKELSEPNVEEKGEKNLNEEMKQVSIFITEEEEEDEGEEEMLSTEELNQKFEEFIMRMKEDIMTNEAPTLVIFK